MREKCPSGECYVVISIYCFTERCGYTMTVSQNSDKKLTENEPLYGFVKAKEYVYYKYYCNIEDNNLVFSLTTINQGDADLYISKGRDSMPSE